jgi:tRNA(Arg) A34 adenosine deaminase TadA
MLGCACATNALPARAQPRCLDLTLPPPVALTPAEQEQHGIFLLLAMALVFDGWGVDRRRPDLVTAFAVEEPERRFAEYLGHNIGALLVDREANIVCFALNRNVQLNSTLEHAEARSVRTAIQLANAARQPSDAPSWSFGNLLQADRLYATLEPCAQCAGILDLANVGSVIYGQDDPRQHRILNVLYNLNQRPRTTGAPLPIQATFLPTWRELAVAYEAFVRAAEPGSNIGLTSFLETILAYRIYKKAALALTSMSVRHAGNTAALSSARMFRARWQDNLAAGIVPPI